MEPGADAVNAARLERSSRLRRVCELLCDGREYSTLEIVEGARVCAVNSIVSELRANGLIIKCRQAVASHGERIWLYRLTSPARGDITHPSPNQQSAKRRAGASR